MEAGRSTGGQAALEHLSVVIADDDVRQRRAVRQALSERGFVVAAESGDATAAAAATARLRPDIVLIELELPGESLSAIGRMAKASPKTLIVVLSRSDRAEDVVAAFTRGASGYLLKGISGERLASTLRAAHRGEPALSRSLVPYLVDEIRRGSVRRLVLPDGPVTLTPREWEVGELLREGHSTAEMAERLGVSPVTVRRHVGLLLKRLGAKNRRVAVEMLRAYGKR
jgi:two-component system nitrate/nitrite response regulator NarL